MGCSRRIPEDVRSTKKCPNFQSTLIKSQTVNKIPTTHTCYKLNNPNWPDARTNIKIDFGENFPYIFYLRPVKSQQYTEKTFEKRHKLTDHEIQ